MQYSFVQIKNFKGIKELRLDFTKSPASPVFTLVGLNESGKTTILEAMSSFTYGKEEHDPLEITGYERPDVHELIPISKRSNFTDEISVELGLLLDDDDNNSLQKVLKAEYKFKDIAPVHQIAVRQVLRFKDSKHQPDDSKNIWSYWLRAKAEKQRKYRQFGVSPQWHAAVAHLSERIPRIIYFQNFLFEFPDRIYLEPSSTGEPNAKESFYRAVVQDVLDSLDNGTTLEKHIIGRANSELPEDRSSLNALLLEVGRNVTRNVFREWSTIFSRKITDKRIRIELNRDTNNRLYLRFLVEDTDGVFEIGERSLGFRWFFVFLLLTHYRGFRKHLGGNVMFLLDEPASNLHSTAQQQLLRSFERLGERCHLVYTTHSHHLINPNWLESTFVVRNAGLDYHGADDPFDFTTRRTDIQAERYRAFAVKHPNQSTYFQPILDVLDYCPSSLENVPDVVLLEGKNDFYAVSFAQWLIATDDSVKLVPGGSGAGSLDTVIRLYIGWGRDFVVLLDSDTEGHTQKKRYRDVFGALLEEKVFTLEDVNPAWKGIQMEDLFTKSDQRQIQEFAYPGDTKLNKSHLNRALQEAFVRRERFSLEEATDKNFQQLIGFLRDKLSETGE
jgi:AAA15 family ATPase/GTPase